MTQHYNTKTYQLILFKNYAKHISTMRRKVIGYYTCVRLFDFARKIIQILGLYGPVGTDSEFYITKRGLF